MRRVELITKRVLVDGKTLPSRSFYIKRDQTILVFADVINDSAKNYIKEFLALNLEVVVVTPLDCSLKLPFLHIITTKWIWYIHTLFKDPLFFNFVFSYGLTADNLARAYSQFTQYTIEWIKGTEQLKDILAKVKNRVLIQCFNGIGDALMALPSLKKLAEKYEVEVASLPDRKPVFENLPYIKKFTTKRKGINLSYYKKFFDITSKFCDYSSERNRKHRIDIIADLLQVGKVEHKIDIILKQKEIDEAKGWIKNLKKRKLVFFYESNEAVRCLPDKYVSSLVPKIKNFDVILVGKKKKLFSVGLNLSGKINLRILFALVYLSDVVLTVDTSGLHIARAFNKPTILLPGLIDYRWRIYDNVFAIPPKIFCYPCNRYKPAKAQCFQGKTCPSFIPQEKILKKLAKI